MAHLVSRAHFTPAPVSPAASGLRAADQGRDPTHMARVIILTNTQPELMLQAIVAIVQGGAALLARAADVATVLGLYLTWRRRTVTTPEHTPPMPRQPETRDFGPLIAHQTADPTRQERLPAPVPTRCTARTYDGRTVTLDGYVSHRAGRWLAFTAEYDEWGEWTAWVDRGCCEAL